MQKQWINENQLRAALLPLHAGNQPQLQLFEEIDSTNAEALRQLQALDHAQRCEAKVFIARRQSAGRGRRGRVWSSESNAGLYLSLVRGFELEAQALQGLSLVVGLAAQAALTQLGAQEVRLKWPNDILVQGRKLGGILLELRRTVESQVVIGIGINLQLGPEQARALERPVIDLAEVMAVPVSAQTLAAALLNQLGHFIEEFEESGFSPFIARWQEVDYYADAAVVLTQGDRRTQGICVGVDDNGALLLRTEEEGQSVLRRFEGGEMSATLRPLE
jgi:BirA family biotin operon repressor/biotin-[acetyl-CoA-carboxylase] ligase